MLTITSVIPSVIPSVLTSVLKRVVAPLLLVALTGCALSPTGEKTLLLNSPQQMNALGAQSFEQMKQAKAIIEAPGPNRFVRCVTDALVRQVPPHYGYGGADWEVVVFDDPAVNAFAVPGARIGVFTGMLDLVANQHELAAVLGHEISHVLAQHSNARLSQRQLTSLGLNAANLLLTDRVAPGAQQAVMGALGLGAQFGVLLPYSRAHEREADLLGQALMADAGFDPAAAARLWQRMATQGQAAPPEFMSTHPAARNRVRDLAARTPELMPLYRQAQAAGRQPRCDRFR
jgi:predicted Zn-dependent protease